MIPRHAAAPLESLVVTAPSVDASFDSYLLTTTNPTVSGFLKFQMRALGYDGRIGVRWGRIDESGLTGGEFVNG